MKGIIIIYIIIGLILGMASAQDIKKKEINIIFIGLIFLISLVGLLFKESIKIVDVFGGASIGIGMIILSLLSKDQIGTGDGMIMAAVGIICGIKTGIVMLCIASLIQCFISVVLLLSKRGNKNTKVPFIPSLFIGYIGSLICLI